MAHYRDVKRIHKKSISLNTMDRLLDIFINNKWDLTDFCGWNYYDSFCERLSEFDNQQQELILKLTESFLWVKESEYMPLFLSVFSSFVDERIKQNNNLQFIITPLLAKEDMYKSKSSKYIFYNIKSDWRMIIKKYSNCKMEYWDISEKKMPSHIFSKIHEKGYTLCLVDDYIGSGDTVRSAISYLEDMNVKRENIVVLSLVAMKAAVTSLLNESIKVYSRCLLDKGLTSLGDPQYNKMMEAIESQLNVSDNNHYGYKGTEALVKMRRTPNNTFPVYWFENKKYPVAPFPR